ncbi:unnamed protein product [Hanseniaspora opuntiae]
MSVPPTTSEVPSVSSMPPQAESPKQQIQPTVLQPYAGNDITTIVLDPGSYNTRIGFAGTDHPTDISSSLYAFDNETPENLFFDDQRILFPKPNREVKSILKNGMIQDFDIFAHKVKFLMKNKLGIEQTTKSIKATSGETNEDEMDTEIEGFHNLPMILTEPIWNPKENRVKSIEMVLESLKFEAIYLLPQQSSVSFAMGKPNCLVVELGHDSCSVSPVFDGFTLSSKSRRSYLNGKLITELFTAKIKEKSKKLENDDGKVDILCNFEVKSKHSLQPKINKIQGLTDSFRNNYNERFFIQECKEMLLQSRTNLSAPIAANGNNRPARSIEAPWGENLLFTEEERYELVDQLFTPDTSNPVIKKWDDDHKEIYSPCHNDYMPLKRNTNNNANGEEKNENEAEVENPELENKLSDSLKGLFDLIQHCIESVDVDFRPVLTNNIIVTGGLSYIPGLITAIQLELTKRLPSFKIKIVTQGNSAMTKERMYHTWLGGSILGSLGSFQQLYVGREELAEVGVDRLLKARFR